jgi:hypothetical protein
MAEQIPLMADVDESALNSWSVPPYSCLATEDATRRFFIVNYMPYAKLAENGSWYIRKEEAGRFAPFNTIINAFKAFVDKFIARGEIGLRPVETPPSSKEELWLCLMTPHYIANLVFDSQRQAFHIPLNKTNLFLTRRTAVETVLMHWDKIQRIPEGCMHVLSDGATDTSKGGTYVSASVGSLRKSLSTLNDSEFLKKFLCDNPVIAKRRLNFLDYGAGFNRPAFVAAVALGWRAHGIECNLTRTRIACEFYSDYLSADLNKNIDVVIHYKADETPLNLSGFSIIMLWDRVRGYLVHRITY